MSKAIICDMCGVILPVDGNYKSIWLVNPMIARGPDEINLCKSCYGKFADESLANINEQRGRVSADV